MRRDKQTYLKFKPMADDFCEGDLYELAVEAEQVLKGGAE